MTGAKEKTRQQGRVSTTTTGYQKKAPRHSPFSPLIGDNGQALRTLEADCFLEKWAASYEGGLATINAYFSDLEEAFIEERSGADFPSSYDIPFLNLWRRDAARELLVKSKPIYHAFIKARATMKITLPPVPKSKMEEWLEKNVPAGGGGRDVA